VSLKLKMDVDVPENLLSEILVTAFDGEDAGCLYWAEVRDYEDGVRDWLITEFGSDNWLSVQIGDVEDDSKGPWIVDHSVIVRGMQEILLRDYRGSQALLKLQGYIREAVIEDDGSHLDAIAVDTIIQIGLFGEEVYA